MCQTLFSEGFTITPCAGEVWPHKTSNAGSGWSQMLLFFHCPTVITMISVIINKPAPQLLGHFIKLTITDSIPVQVL